MRRTLTASLGSKSAKASMAHAPQTLPPAYTDHDLQAVLRSLNDSWDGEVARMQRYLLRNHNIAHGLPIEGEEVEERPTTARSLEEFLESVRLDRTPTLEKEVGLGLGLDLNEKSSVVEEAAPLRQWSNDPEKD